MRNKNTLFAMLICIVATGNTAFAADVSVSLNEPESDIGVPIASTIVGEVLQNVTGSVSGVRLSPWDNTSHPDGTYTSISSNSAAGYVVDEPISGFTVMLGSIDAQNVIQFLLQGTATGEIIVGQDVIDAGAQSATGFVVATIMTDNPFDEVRFLSSSNALEYANLDLSIQ